MREIKFRVWDKKRNCFYWSSRPFNGIDNCQLFIDICGELTSVNYPNNEISEGNFILQQYTGLKDKNGKEIYEGDIISTRVMDEVIPDLEKHNYHLLVFFSNHSHAWCGKTKDQDEFSCEHFTFAGRYEILLEKTKVIGNIFENEDLLK